MNQTLTTKVIRQMSRFVLSYIHASNQQTHSNHKSPLTYHNFPSTSSITKWLVTIAYKCLVGQSLQWSGWKTMVCNVNNMRTFVHVAIKVVFWGLRHKKKDRNLLQQNHWKFSPPKFLKDYSLVCVVKGAEKWMTNDNVWYTTICSHQNTISQIDVQMDQLRSNSGVIGVMLTAHAHLSKPGNIVDQPPQRFFCL